MYAFVDLNKVLYPPAQTYKPVTTISSLFTSERTSFQLELGRGCPHKCKFCLVGRLLNKGRYRDYNKVLELVELGVKETGVQSIDVYGTNLSDYSRLTELCWKLVNQGLSLSITTIRPDKVTQDLMEAIKTGGQKSLTIAPEAGTERLRYIIGKTITNDRVLESAKLIFEAGLSLKNFLLTGLPTETEEDRIGLIELVKEEFSYRINDDQILRADINPVVPKWQTPFKNWVYYYLPKNRIKLRRILNNFYNTLDKIPKIW